MTSTYQVKEIFDTLQGEGGRTGARSVFIRLAGCNLWNGKSAGRPSGRGACARWCDTDFVDGVRMDAAEIRRAVDDLWPPGGADERWVVLTGGEPCLQLDEALVDALASGSIRIALETNGMIDAPALARVDWVSVSPKLGAAVTAEGLAATAEAVIAATSLQVRAGAELRVVIPGGLGGVDWTDAALVALRAATHFERYYLSPLDPEAAGRGELEAPPPFAANAQRCAQFVRRHPAWRLSLQTHKWIGLP